MRVQEAAIKKATENATIEEVPNAMIDKKCIIKWINTPGNMQRQGISPKMYYQFD